MEIKSFSIFIILFSISIINIKSYVLFENDILLDSSKAIPGIRRMKRAAVAKKEKLWDFGVVPYEIDPIFSGVHKAQFKLAMKHWERYTCIKFVQRNASEHKDFIRFTELPCGCCSHVGRQGRGSQNVSIGKNCHKFGIIVHELGHAIGFWHEHTRPDRDEFVTIIAENILVNHEYNFNKLTRNEVDTLGEPYDYNSIMHYARNTYSKSAFKDTILPNKIKGKGKRPEIGQRKQLSPIDIIQTKKLYKCTKCGRTFQEHSVAFHSSDYHEKELANGRTECEWRISATNGELISLNISDLNIFNSTDCSVDYLEIYDGYWQRSPLLGRLCGSTKTIDLIQSTGNRLLMVYITTHNEYHGFSAAYEAICGGNLTGHDTNSIESPNYPLFYSPSKQCIWQISMPTGYQIALEFHTFDLEYHPDCENDFIEIRDGQTERSRLIGTYCGNSLPPILASTSNHMFVKFVSDASGQNAGFSATFYQEFDECKSKTHKCAQNCINTLAGYKCSCRLGYRLGSDKNSCEVSCGGIIDASNGTIASPGFPRPYPPSQICIWEIHANKQYLITLNFTHFQLEGSNLLQENCDYDAVTISSKTADEKLKKQGVYCSERLPPLITSETNVMRVKFQSDGTIQRSGFSASFVAHLDKCAISNGGCGHLCRNTLDSIECLCKNGWILHENGKDCVRDACQFEVNAPTGMISSENYPKNYSKNTNCIWHFTARPGHRVRLEFLEFDTEYDSQCSNDFVTIHIDVDPFARRKNNYVVSDTYTLGKFCGNDLPHPITSPAHGMYMTFKTDNSIQRSSFMVQHSTVCGGHFSATETDLKYIYSHAKYGDTYYDKNMDCDFIIEAQYWQRILLIFHTFDVEDEQACSFDYIDIYDGQNDEDGYLYGRFCGTQLPLQTVSLHQSLLLRFRTDDDVHKKGFYATYTVANSTTIQDFETDSEKYNQVKRW